MNQLGSLLAALLMTAVVAAQGSGTPGATLTETDRAEIQQLVARYARALGSCSANEYADLFTPDGVFVSDDFRGAKHRELYGPSGRIQGRAKLVELVQTEEFCIHPAPVKSGSATTSRPVPSVIIEPSAEGATGRASLGAAGGHYEDVYVKTADGWRFKRRTVFMPPKAGSPAAPTTSSR
jgi:SnoaL-like domain